MLGNSRLEVFASGWSDGVYEKQALEACDRWALQDSDELEAVLLHEAEEEPHKVVVGQYRNELGEVGVGALLWEASVLLAAHSGRVPLGLWRGARVCELGAGLGLNGLLAARLGAAHVTLTDTAGVVPLLTANLARNRERAPLAAAAQELLWGDVEAARALRAAHVGTKSNGFDIVLAADFCYPVTGTWCARRRFIHI
mmetsp:Transcript_328/g.1030  ORF Transcript_328/g.1030 Transcript_328/m.1030 type:complete len:198 (+) Transcript_328:32-625(+)